MIEDLVAVMNMLSMLWLCFARDARAKSCVLLCVSTRQCCRLDLKQHELNRNVSGARTQLQAFAPFSRLARHSFFERAKGESSVHTSLARCACKQATSLLFSLLH